MSEPAILYGVIFAAGVGLGLTIAYALVWISIRKPRP